MSVIDSLITDRSGADIARRSYLKERVSNKTATEDEIAEWLTPLKGSYNYTDWNRVGEACAYLYEAFTKYGYNVPNYTALKTDWTIKDLPDSDYWGVYLKTVNALKSVWNTVQDVPETMKHIGVDGANNIERVLVEIDAILTRIGGIFPRAGMSWAAAGNTMIYAIN